MRNATAKQRFGESPFPAGGGGGSIEVEAYIWVSPGRL